MYCDRVSALKDRVSPTFSQPATVPEGGNALAALLQPVANSNPAPNNNATATPARFLIVFMTALLLPSQQNLTAGRPALADTGYVHRRMLLQRAGVLTRSATHASAGIDTRLLQRLLVPVCIHNLRFLHIDRLGRNRAPLLADDAVGRHGPGQAAAAIVKGCSQAHRLLFPLAHADHPSLFARGRSEERAGWADLGAKHATRLAIDRKSVVQGKGGD